MSDGSAPEAGGFIDARDREYIEAMPDAGQRAAALCVIGAYRRPDRLAVGDPVPALKLASLDSGLETDLGARRNRPLLLLFGSYT